MLVIEGIRIYMSFFEDLKKDLLEAIEIESGTVSLEERKGMPAKTYYSENPQGLNSRQRREPNSCSNASAKR